jgi:hypothetical protein
MSETPLRSSLSRRNKASEVERDIGFGDAADELQKNGVDSQCANDKTRDPGSAPDCEELMGLRITMGDLGQKHMQKIQLQEEIEARR